MSDIVPIPILDARASYHEVKCEIDSAIARVLESGVYISGKEVESFEQEWAAYCGAAHAIGVGNGLDALRLALMAIGIQPGDEVIVPSNTFIATWLAISQCGAKPIPVEPIETTYNLDAARIRSAISSRTRCIVAVHLFGQPADLDPIFEIAREYGLRVIEDAAQAHGARYKGRSIGAHADAVAWSFYPGKNLGAFGDGGAVTTNSPQIADSVRLFGNYGSKKKYVNDVQGVNSRLDPLHAAVLRVKLERLDEWNGRRRTLAARYDKALEASCNFHLPIVPQWAEPVWHLYVIRTPHRKALSDYLVNHGIGNLVHYPIPPHLQQAYLMLGYRRGDLPISELLADEVLSIPIGPHLSFEQQDRIIEALLKFDTR